MAFARTAVLTLPDPRLGGFSNEASERIPLTDPAARQGVVYTYVAREPISARRRLKLDLDDMAGESFGIPACCRDWFSSSWELARHTYGGDLAAVLASRAQAAGQRVLRPRWEVNAFAMYFGAGLCWHFPCSFACEATSAAVAARSAELHSAAPALWARLVQLQQRTLLWTERYGVAIVPRNKMLAGLRWVAAAPEINGSLPTITLDEIEDGSGHAELSSTLDPWLLLRWSV